MNNLLMLPRKYSKNFMFVFWIFHVYLTSLNCIYHWSMQDHPVTSTWDNSLIEVFSVKFKVFRSLNHVIQVDDLLESLFYFNILRPYL